MRFAVDEACAHGVRSWAYVAKILNRYMVSGIRSVEQARQEKQDSAVKAAPPSGKKVTAQDYHQRAYTEEELRSPAADALLREAERNCAFGT